MAAESPSQEADVIWEEIQSVLHDYGFSLDRVDRRAGIITTVPETSQSLFEPWRRDVATIGDLLESTLNCIRRWVEVRIDWANFDSWSSPEVIVHKERLTGGEQPFNTTGSAFQYFTQSRSSAKAEKQPPPQRGQWISIGRDPALESRLLQLIRRRLDLLGAEGAETRDKSGKGGS